MFHLGAQIKVQIN